MMKTRKIVTTPLLFLATSMLALPASPQDVSPPPLQAARVAAGTVKYQCLVTMKDARIEKASIEAASEDAAKKAAARKFGSRAVGTTGVSCARATESSTLRADSSAPKEGVKTRAPAPPIFVPRSGIEFGKDGSCKLSPEAMATHPDARDKCRELSSAEGGGFECPASYCATLR
jgi:hypothetical protein